MVACLRGQTAQLARSIKMMILKRPGEDRTDSQLVERLPEGIGVTEATERGYRAAWLLCFHRCPGVNPALRVHRREKHRSRWVQLTETFPNSPIFAPRLRSGDDEHTSACEGRQRLPQASAGEHGAAGKWIERVDQHYVEIAFETPVLEAVVEQERVHVQLF